MVYKKYIKRGGKLYGPYIYKSVKKDGKVITQYLGSAQEAKGKNSFSKKSLSLGIVIIAVTLLFILSFNYLNFTGNVSFFVEDSYTSGENLKGDLKITLEENEFIPADTRVIIDNAGEKFEYLLSDLVSEEPIKGNYYIKGKDIFGNGRGYGFGDYPSVEFVLKVFSGKEKIESSKGEIEQNVSEVEDGKNETVEGIEQNSSEENEGEIDEVGGVEENLEGQIGEGMIKNKEDDKEDSLGEISEEKGNKEEKEKDKKDKDAEGEKEIVVEEEIEGVGGSVLITGEAVLEEQIEGKVSFGDVFVYTLLEGQTAKLISSAKNIDFIIEGNQVIITTNYPKKKEFLIDVGELNLPAKGGQLKLTLIYEGVELASGSEAIKVDANETEEIINQTLEFVNETLIVNETIEDVSVGNISVSTIQYGAVLNRPVKWKKNVKLDKSREIKLEIPKEAENISVYKIEGIKDKEGETESKEIIEKEVSEEVVNETELVRSVNETSEIESSVNESQRVSITAEVISGELTVELDLRERSVFENFFLRLFKFITGRIVDVEEKEEVTEIVIDDNATEYEIEYETPAPVANETITGYGKEIVISSDLHYTNILAYTELPYPVLESQIKLYHYENGTRELVGFVGYEIVERTPLGVPLSAEYWGNETEIVENTTSIDEKSPENVTKEILEFVNQSYEKNKKGSNGAEPNRLKTDYDIFNDDNYINVSTNIDYGHAEMAERITQSIENRCPSGCVGLSPTLGVTKLSGEINQAGIDETNVVVDRLISYIEWVVPHLSNQTYELVIEITKAEHLDSNRSFISDIYDFVKEKDDNWSEAIGDGEYVRVTFEVPLDNTRDITLYARGVGNVSSNIEVYEQDGEDVVAVFGEVSEENWYKVYLTGLNGSNDVFDLKIIGSVEFDYIVDPASAYNISFVPPTPDNATVTTNTSVEINVSILNAGDLDSVIYNWNGTNTTCGILSYFDVGNHSCTNYDDSDLVLAMNFDNVSSLGENDTYVVDLSVGGNNGTVYGGTDADSGWTSSGKYAGGQMFNGSGDYVAVSDDTNIRLANDYSIGLWFIKNSAGSYQALITKESAGGGGGWYLDSTNGEKLRHSIGNPSAQIVSSTGSHAVGQWVYAVLTHTGGRTYFYINGVLNSDFAHNYVPASDSDPLLIGKLRADVPEWFGGKIDEVRIYNRSLSADEVYQQYISNLNKYDTDKWALYVNQSLNATDGLTDGAYTYQAFAKDTSGNVNDTGLRTITIQEDMVVPAINFTSPTPANASTQTATNVEVNVSILNASDLDEVTWNWNGTNFTMYNDSLVLMMNFDNVSSLGENDTYVVDLSVGGNNGTASNTAVNTTNCKYGNCYIFEGTSDIVTVNDDESLDFGTGDFTISWWEYIKGISTVISKGSHGDGANGWYIDRSGASIYVKFNYDVLQDTDGTWQNIGASTNTWEQITIVRNVGATTLSIYVNGVLKWSNNSVNTPNIVDAQDLWIGDSAGRFDLNGSIDEVRIYNRSLSADEVYQQYVSNLNKYDTDKWALYVNQSLNATDGLPDGSYTYQAFAEDTSSNLNFTDLRTVTITDYCDQGTRAGSCNVTTLQNIPNNTNLVGYGNIIFKSGGSWNNSAGEFFTINASTITIQSGGSITGNANITATNLTIETGGSINLNGKGFSGGAVNTNGNGPGGGEKGIISGGGGSTIGGGGAGYAGYGGDGGGYTYIGSYTVAEGGVPYGSLMMPLYLGSGGAGGNTNWGGGWSAGGGSGGGALFLNITDVLNVSGIISVNGNGGSYAGNGAGGGGSGGSIYIITDNFLGNGSLTSDGGNGGNTDGSEAAGGGGGSGGRIAIHYTTKGYTGNYSAYSGDKGSPSGQSVATSSAAGTIYLNGSNIAYLILDNGQDIVAKTTPLGTVNLTIGNESVINNVKFNMTGNMYFNTSRYQINGTTMTISSGNFSVPDNSDLTLNATSMTAQDLNGPVNFSLIGSTVSLSLGSSKVIDDLYLTSSTLSYGSGTQIYINNDITFSGTNTLSLSYLNISTLTIPSGVTLTHPTGSSYGLNITADNLTIESGGSINLAGKGSAGGAGAVGNPATGAAGSGIGAGGGGASSVLAGMGGGGASYAGYGGDGGKWISNGGGTVGAGGEKAYGSLVSPVDLGSGGGGGASSQAYGSGGRGGGKLFLHALDTVNISGTVSADGADGGDGWRSDGAGGGGGSGGSIYIITNNFLGNGSLTSLGGDGGLPEENSAPGGSGSGGRIAVHYTTSEYTGDFSAYGDISHPGWTQDSQQGSAGTIFLNGSTYSDLIIDNDNTQGLSTILNSSLLDEDLGNISIVDGATVLFNDAYYVLNATGILNLTNASLSVSSSSNELHFIFGNQFIDTLTTYPSTFSLTYENSSAGQIKFLQGVTSVSNLDDNIAIGNNYVFVNSTAVGGLNKSANITMTGSGDVGNAFAVVLKDGVECSDCYAFTSLTASTVIFNVTSWTNYSIGGLPPRINFTSPTPANASTIGTTFVEINVSIEGDNLDEVKYNWNGTNFTMFNDSLRLMMNFDNVSSLGENETYVVDVSGNGNNGIWGNLTTGNINYTTGKYENGIEFDSVDDFIEFPKIQFATTQSFSICSWVNVKGYAGGPGDFGVYGRVVSFKSGSTRNYELSLLEGTNQVFFSNCDSTSDTWGTPGLISNNEWHFVCGVHSNEVGTNYIYVDGLLDGIDTAIQNNCNPGINTASIGAGIEVDGSYTGFFNGSIDEIRIWNRSLSADEVYQQYVSNLNKYDTDKWLLYVNQSLNATDGLGDGNYTFQAFAQDEAGNLNFTDLRSVSVDLIFPIVNLIAPVNASVVSNLTQWFAANFTDVNLNNATPYIWNSSGSLINSSETQVVTGISNNSNASIILPYDDTFEWNYYVCDGASNCVFNLTNWTLNVDAVSPFYITNCTNLTEVGATYYLTQDIVNSVTSNCMNIQADNVILDCQGFTIDGDWFADNGIYVNSATNVTVKNCILTDWDTQTIYLYISTDGTLDNVTVDSSTDDGILFNGADRYTVIDVNISNSADYGARMTNTRGTIIINSTFMNSGLFDFHIGSINDFGDCNHKFINVNGTENKPIAFFNNSAVTLEHWDNNASEIFLCNADNSVLNNITLDRTGTENNGIFLFETNGSNLSNIYVNHMEIGVYLVSSDLNILTNITSTFSDSDGIQISGGDLNILKNITLFNNGITGLQMTNSDSNNITTVNPNINAQTQSDGIHLDSISNSNIFTDLWIQGNDDDGMDIDGDDNIIQHSTIRDQSGSGDNGIIISDDRNQIINVTFINNDIGITLNPTADDNIIVNSTFDSTGANKDSVNLVSGQSGNAFYNNLFNESEGSFYVTLIGATAWNTTSSSAINIIGDPAFGGNYWTNSSATGYSDTCTDSDTDGYCDDTYDLKNNTIGCTSSNCDYLVLSGKYSSMPQISIVYPTNNTNSNNVNLDVNYTAVSVDLDSCWYSNDTMSVNTSLGTGGSCLNITNVVWAEGKHNVTIWANNTFEEENSSSVSFTIDTTSPVVANGSGMVASGSIGGEATFFNWTGTDNMDLVLDCYPTFSGNFLVAGNLVYTANNSYENTIVNLPGGQHVINITCYDDANNSGQSQEAISYLVAGINITAPLDNNRTNRIVRNGETTNFVINETSGADFLNNVTILIKNSTDVLAQEYCVVNGDVHTCIYTWENYSQPFNITIQAISFNNSVGMWTNVTDTINLMYLRPEGTTNSPSITSAYPNRTYNFYGNESKISLIADLDTLFFSDNLTVKDPDNVSVKLNATESLLDSDGFINYLNYTLNLTKNGTYVLYATVQDYEGAETSTWSYNFYTTPNSRIVVLNDTREIKIHDVGNNNVLWNNTDLLVTFPANGFYDVVIDVIDTLKNISLRFENVNLSNMSEVLNYTSLTNETSAPLGERRIETFDLDSNLSYDNYSLVFYYSLLEHLLINESNLKIYKCENVSNCSLGLVSTTLDTTVNTITAVLTNMSRFMVAENSSEVVTETVTETVTVTTGGGGGTTIVYNNIELITPGKATMELTDEIVLPITVKNPIKDKTLKGLKFSAVSNTADLSMEFDKDEIDTLTPLAEENINMIISSHSTPGDYEIILNATVDSPKITETSRIYIKLVENLEGDFVKERIVLVQDLFKENPDCLEFNDYVLEAEQVLELEPIKAKNLLEYAIKGCKELITSKEGGFQQVVSALKKQWERPVVVASVLFAVAMIIVMIVLRGKTRRRELGKLGYGGRIKKKRGGFFSGLFKKTKKKSRKVKKGVFDR